MAVKTPGRMPAALFLVGYEELELHVVKLDSPHGEEGSLFEWRLEDGGFYSAITGFPTGSTA